MNGNNDTPDKRTTAYENIFGRPTAKPKGPNSAYPPSNGGLPPGIPAGTPWTGNQQAYMTGQPMPRYNGNSNVVGPSNTPYRTPQQMYAYQQQQQQQQQLQNNPALAMQPIDAADRRISVAPSVASNENRTSTYFAGGSAADAYGSPSNQVGYHAQPNTYLRANSTSPAPAQRPLPSVQSAYTSASLRHASESSLPPYIRQPSGPTSVSPPMQETSLGNPAPRLPSFDLGGGQGVNNEDSWFSNGSGVAAIDLGGKNGTTISPPLASTSRMDENPQSPAIQTDGGGDDADIFATGDEGMYRNGNSALREGGGGDEKDTDRLLLITSSDYQDYQRQLHDEQQSQSRSTSLLRKNSVESDRRSVATSQYNAAGATSASSRMYYAQGSNATASGYFQAPTPLTQYTTEGNANNWTRQPRLRTASSATTQAISHRETNSDWRRSTESGSTAVVGAGGTTGARSMSFGQQSAPKQGMIISPHGSIASGPAALSAANNRRGPLVYPALLSKIAEAFKHRVAVSERQKDGLAYTDAFDGREAVDKIAYIIKTTDRNLALLLGRALDAQKFFHDVTYDHRLRDSPNELYQFRVRLTSPFGSEAENYEDAVEYRPNNKLGVPEAKGVTRDNSTSTMQDGDKLDRLSPSIQQQLTPSTLAEDEEDALPTGVFTLLTDCYSPTCTRDRLCYSIACPRRLEQQARLNMKPQPGLKRSISKESLGDVKEPGALWAESVSADVLKSVSEGERKRQELINEVIYTERDFVRDIEYLRDSWIKPLRSRDVVPEARREDFVTQVFWNVLEIHTVNSKLAEMLTKRQKQQDVVDRIGDILLEMVPHFGPFVKYGAHQLYGKYEFEKEKSSNPAFTKFVDETERLPESRKLELNGYLTKPTTRLARYPLLLEAVIKATPEDNPDKQALPKVVKIVKEFLSKVNTESGKSENRFNLAQLDQQLVFKQGEAVDLRLRDEQRELVFKGPLKKRGGTQSESAELQVFLFDHAMLMVKAKTVHKNDLYKVFRKPIPLELLIVTVYDEVPTGKGNATRPKSVMSKTSTGNRLSGQAPTGSAPKQDVKTGYALTFTYLGRKGYSQTLWASTFVSRKKWFENIETRQEILRQRSNIFDTITLAEGFFNGPSRVTCSVPFDFGRRIIYGADDGVYLSDLRERARPPTKVLPLPGVTQVDVLEEYQILIILAEKSVHTFTLDALDPTDPVGSLKRGRRISSHTSFFKAGQCLGRTLVCVVKSSSLSSTIKTLEPIEQNLRVGKKQQTFRKLLQGGQDTLRVFKEFYIPTESSSIHFLKTKLCVGCTKGFEIVDLETLDTQGLLDPADSNLDFVQKKENVKPIAIYRIEGEFLLCYDEFAFYVNKNGWRSKGNWIIHWEGNPTAFALHHPYVLAFEPSFIEVRHVTTGALHQVITGYNLRCLFADVPPPSSGSANSSNSSANSSSTTLHAGMAGLGGGMSPYNIRPPMHYAIGAPPYSALARQQSFNVMGQVPPPPPPPSQIASAAAAAQSPQQPPYLGRTSTSSIGPPSFAQPNLPQQIAQPLPSHTYSRPPPLSHHHTSPNMPFSPYGQGQVVTPRQASTQRNPVWESVAASRNQIVFIGDTTVFCVRPAGPTTTK